MRFLWFTMDSLASRDHWSYRGGPSGERLVREAVVITCSLLGHELVVLGSDEEYVDAREDLTGFDGVVVDPWTAVGPGGQVDHRLRAHGGWAIVDFFGHESASLVDVPRSSVLTAYPEGGGVHVGFAIGGVEAAAGGAAGAVTSAPERGLVWAKRSEEVVAAWPVVRAVAEVIGLDLVVHDPDPVRSLAGADGLDLRYLGILDHDGWLGHLAGSALLLGLGDPLLGPSAIEAVAVGCPYLNPVFDPPRRLGGGEVGSQHDHARGIGVPHVVDYVAGDPLDATRAARAALAVRPPPLTGWWAVAATVARVAPILQAMADRHRRVADDGVAGGR